MGGDIMAARKPVGDAAYADIDGDVIVQQLAIDPEIDIQEIAELEEAFDLNCNW